MTTRDPKSQLEHLIGEIDELVRPRHLNHAVQDTTGVFVPGFAALPAVTILSSDSWKTKARPAAEVWRTGELIAMTLEGDAGTDARLQHVFFSPICDVTLPLLDISITDETSSFARTFRLSPHDRWNDVTVHFAFFPWGTGEDFEWNGDELAVIGEKFQIYRRRLTVTAEVGDQKVAVDPIWGPSTARATAVLDGARFALNHARETIAPFLFRLSLTRRMLTSTGDPVSLEGQPIDLRFEFPERASADLYRETGIAAPRTPGISLFANALPLANLDLKAWPAGDPFADFVRESGMKPIGVAGIFRYKRVGEEAVSDRLQSHANVFSMEIEREGMVLNRYGLPGDEDSTKDKQLLLWMTLGNEVNGRRFQYKPQSIRQPLEKKSEILANARTVVPCFGGADCFPGKSAQVYGNLMMNVAAVPQMFAFRDGLLHAAEDVVARLGYERVTVETVQTELRVVDGVRRRVVAVYLENRARNPIDPGHIRVIQSYLAGASPVGVEIVVEENARGG